MRIAMLSRYQRPGQRRMLRLRVAGRHPVSPHLIRVTLSGPNAVALESSGGDQSGRLFFRDPLLGPPVLPLTIRWMPEYLRLPAARRPRVRLYTVRRFRPEDHAIDIDIVVHDRELSDGAGPGTRWASTAEDGEEVAFLDEGATAALDSGAAWRLLVGDESALPAIAAILERSGPSLAAEVFAEAPTGADVLEDLRIPDGTTAHWLSRDDHARRPGALALETLRRAQLPAGTFTDWVAGESALATGARRHLVSERGVATSDIVFTGYWRAGKASRG